MALATGFRVVIQQRAALEVEPAVLWREERRVLRCRSADVPIGESVEEYHQGSLGRHAP